MTQKIITVFLVITGVVLIGIARAGISPVDFTTSAKSDEEGRELLRLLGLPLRG